MLNGKTAVVTGASRGIGAAIAEKLASMGANIAIIDYGDAGEEKAKIAAGYGVRVEAYNCDVSSTQQCTETVKRITDDFGGFDILVNNAGITRDNLIVTMEEAEFDAVMGTNRKGTFKMRKASGRNFIRRKYGKIINIASVSALIGVAGQANYSSSKAGIIALTKVTAREFGGKNVCCNAIAPGFIKTKMTEELGRDGDILKQIPLKRLGEVEDVAQLAAFLASPESDYITGEVIRVDGGLAM